MNQARGQVSEQAYMTQRNIQNQAQTRGLGSSGLTNLANFQAQQQAGQAISDIEQQNQAVQSEAMNVRRSLMNELSSATRGADLTYAQQLSESDERQFQQERSMREFDVNFLSTLAELSNAGQGGLAQQLASAYYSGDIDTSPEGIAKFVQDADPVEGYNAFENEQLASGYSKNGWNKAWNWLNNWAGLESLISTFRASTGRSPRYDAWLTSSGITSVGVKSTQTFNIGGKEIVTTSKADAQNKIEAALAEQYPEIKSGKIKVHVRENGTVVFQVGSTKNIKTLGEALQTLRAAATGQTPER